MFFIVSFCLNVGDCNIVCSTVFETRMAAVCAGDVVNLGADFCLMPSLFEPGGIVQQEFFVAGTPVIAFKTGGLKDTVSEFNMATKAGNGFTFEAYNRGDLVAAIQVRLPRGT